VESVRFTASLHIPLSTLRNKVRRRRYLVKEGIMKSSILFSILTAVAVLCVFSVLLPETASAATAGKVWVPEHTLADGTFIPGHWRPAKKPGFTWVEGRIDGGIWVAGYWKPVGAVPVGTVWKAGYWRNGKWHSGRWIKTRPGKIWVPGHWQRGRWVPGRWR